MVRPSVLTVCTGNICRSPFIERVLQAGIDRAWGAGSVRVRSAGTHALTGRPMEPLARAELEAGGVDTEGFSARQLQRELIAEASLVLTATREHRAAVAVMHPASLRYTFTLLDFADLVRGCPPEAWPPATEDPQEWIEAVTSTLAGRRGLNPPLSPAEADIPDPYGGPAAAYREMATLLSVAIPDVLRALSPTPASPPRSLESSGPE